MPGTPSDYPTRIPPEQAKAKWRADDEGFSSKTGVRGRLHTAADINRPQAPS
jgi:hypothetical protein